MLCGFCDVALIFNPLHKQRSQEKWITVTTSDAAVRAFTSINHNEQNVETLPGADEGTGV